MKIEDAIYCLRMDTCTKCIGYDECMEETGTGRCFEAASMGADALEKQIPMKPKEADFDRRMYCPVCEHIVYVRYITHAVYVDYCAYCGQKLDWKGIKK